MNAEMKTIYTRREMIAAAAAAIALRTPLKAGSGKPMRGVFPIVATPYTRTGAVDFEDLEREVDFLDRCGAHGIAWPQLASGYRGLTKEERMRGMETLAKAAKGKKTALVLGVQAANTAQMLEFVEKAESLAPDALIAMPPYDGKSLDEYRVYYRALARASHRPIFMQTTGGAKGIEPPVEFLVDLAREFPHLGHVKEELEPLFRRMKTLIGNKPAVKAVFSGMDGTSLTYEMRIGSDGTMPAASLTDIHVQVWNLYQAGEKDKAREVFGAFLLMRNAMREFPNLTPYLLKRRGVFKNAATRGVGGKLEEVRLERDEAEEVEYTFASIQPFLKV
jgi:dihydrodipicolinate synthase/N-acetylneuraminate lyase